MNNNNTVVDIQLLSKHFQFKCPQGQESRLQQAALLFEQQLKKMETQGEKTLRFEHAMVMAALNLSGELLDAQHKINNLEYASERIIKLRQRLEKIVAAHA